MKENAITTVKFVGVSDDVTTCECCGKRNLKRTVALELLTGSIVRYGVTCAAKALGEKTSAVHSEADAIAYAQHLINADKYTPEQIREAVWNRFGFITAVKEDLLKIGPRAFVSLTSVAHKG